VAEGQRGFPEALQTAIAALEKRSWRSPSAIRDAAA
jgi:hypothetical protein